MEDSEAKLSLVGQVVEAYQFVDDKPGESINLDITDNGNGEVEGLEYTIGLISRGELSPQVLIAMYNTMRYSVRDFLKHFGAESSPFVLGEEMRQVVRSLISVGVEIAAARATNKEDKDGFIALKTAMEKYPQLLEAVLDAAFRDAPILFLRDEMNNRARKTSES